MKKSNSPDTRRNPILIVRVAIVLAMALAFSCSSSDNSGDDGIKVLSSSSETILSSPSCSSSEFFPSSSTEQSSSSSVFSSSSVELVSGSCDIIDYRTVTIGNQIWMAENFNCNVSGSECYDNDPVNCDKYGRLYDWATAMALPASCNSNSCSSQIDVIHRGICPSGWHLPSGDEWKALASFAGNYAGEELKAESGWYGGGNGTDKYGFSALPSGTSYSDGRSSLGAGRFCRWWGADDADDVYYNYYSISYDSKFFYYGHDDKTDLISVRCVKD